MRITARSHSSVITADTVGYLKSAIGFALAVIVSDAAEPFVQTAKAIVPVDTGLLQSTIEQKLIENTYSRAVARVQPDTPYAAFVEYGTSRMRAQPYMRPAFEQEKGNSAEIIKRSLTREIKNALSDATNAVAAARNKRMTRGH